MRIYTHPENAKLIREAFQVRELPCDVVLSAYLPIRNIKRTWFPPANDRFVTYEAADHGWLKALGYGEVRDVDLGPYIVAIGDPPTFRSLVLDQFWRTPMSAWSANRRAVLLASF